jgi:hypothetical protein
MASLRIHREGSGGSTTARAKCTRPHRKSPNRLRTQCAIFSPASKPERGPLRTVTWESAWRGLLIRSELATMQKNVEYFLDAGNKGALFFRRLIDVAGIN